ncbi:MAG: hypothetical protein HY314_07400 [Acidobacteria bacterium]|nr:hypothetical protein [Acidobacteriota bacterium]
MEKTSIAFALLFFVFGWSAAMQAQWVTNHNPLPQPNIPKPSVGSVFADPVFGTSVVRITDARAIGAAGIVPDYSKRQAWNADETLMLLRTGDGNTLLFDDATYQFKKVLDGVGGEDVFWHPTNPSLVLYNPDNVFYSYNVQTDVRTQLYAFTDYTFANTRGEGNLSRDGRYYAFVGQLYDEVTYEVTFKDLVVFDLMAGQVVSKLALPLALEAFDWVSISPLGNYVVVDYADDVPGRFHGVEVYDRMMNFLWQKPLGAGHSDLGIDANGDEVLVMDVYDAETNSTFIKKFRLADGRETTLLDLSALFDLHISCQNEKHREWCFVSTFDYVDRLTDDSASWLPFEDEVFALKLDGSQQVQRIAHHHSRRYSPTTPDSDTSVYIAEPHATVSRNGDRILFGSNWRENVQLESSVDAYVVDFRNFGKSDVHVSEDPNRSKEGVA